jgi:hypothetical protein
LDAVLPHKEALEAFLKNRLGKLFGIEYDLPLYDVTGTYFEGQVNANPLTQRGYARPSARLQTGRIARQESISVDQAGQLAHVRENVSATQLFLGSLENPPLVTRWLHVGSALLAID